METGWFSIRANDKQTFRTEIQIRLAAGRFARNLVPRSV